MRKISMEKEKGKWKTWKRKKITKPIEWGFVRYHNWRINIGSLSFLYPSINLRYSGGWKPPCLMNTWMNSGMRSKRKNGLIVRRYSTKHNDNAFAVNLPSFFAPDSSVALFCREMSLVEDKAGFSIAASINLT
jgi:hypothetical protein